MTERHTTRVGLARKPRPGGGIALATRLRVRFRRLGVLSLLVSVSAGCGEGAAPFDELALRDALRADPEAIAALPAPARARLAARFEDARTADATPDDVLRAAGDPGSIVTTLDEARTARLADALVVGAVTDGVARPLRDATAAEDALPPFEGEPTRPTAALEAAALDGAARPPLLALLRASGAHRLERVTAWPVGAIAIDDAVYVNAAWLVALAPAGADAQDGGAAAEPTTATATATVTPAPPPARARAAEPADAGALSSSTVEVRSSALSLGASVNDADGGFAPSPTDYQCGQALGDGCSSDDSGDSCDDSSNDGSDDSCSSSSDDGGDSCGGAADDGAGNACSAAPDDGAGCEIAGRRKAPRRRSRDAGTWSFMLAPLAFLLSRRRA